MSGDEYKARIDVETTQGQVTDEGRARMDALARHVAQMTTTPQVTLMTDERLAQIRDRVENQVATQVEAEYLLVEIDRLRTENAALRLDNAEGRRAKGEIPQLQLELSHQDVEIERLRAENAAMREIVQAVAHPADDHSCQYCMRWEATGESHYASCPVSRSRALLATPPQE